MDIYACGAILYELLTGRLPFEAELAKDIMLMQLTQTPPPIDEVVPDRAVPDFICEAVSRALAIDPAQRFDSAREFSIALNSSSGPLSQRVRLRACPSCYSSMPLNMKFCGECGNQLVEDQDVPPPPRTLPALPLPLIGREDTLDLLHGERDLAARGRLNGLVLSGASGVGKTRVLSEFVAACETRGDLVVQLRPTDGARVWLSRDFEA